MYSVNISSCFHFQVTLVVQCFFFFFFYSEAHLKHLNINKRKSPEVIVSNSLLHVTKTCFEAIVFEVIIFILDFIFVYKNIHFNVNEEIVQ